jgi:hypothetical protein
MNVFEQSMVEKLKELRQKYGAFAVKAEFEAEGTKIEELLRLKEICMRAQMGLVLKIGGCESIRDMLEAKIVGVNYLVAPMVESAYALRKYLQAVRKVFTEQERRDIEILTNIETLTACNSIKEMLEIPEIDELRGIVVERVDLCNSMQLGEESINGKEISKILIKTLEAAKKKKMITVVGGGVSAESIPLFKQLKHKSLDRYETRKVCFDIGKAMKVPAEKGIIKALAFELLWLKNKMGFYKNISIRDKQRMEVIEHRYWKEMDSII